MKPRFSENELLARERAMMEYRRRHKTTMPADENAVALYRHLTRHQHAQLVERERMRYEAEKLRGHIGPAAMARKAYHDAKAGLLARDRLNGRSK